MASLQPHHALGSPLDVIEQVEDEHALSAPYMPGMPRSLEERIEELDLRSLLTVVEKMKPETRALLVGACCAIDNAPPFGPRPETLAASIFGFVDTSLRPGRSALPAVISAEALFTLRCGADALRREGAILDKRLDEIQATEGHA